MKRLAALAVLVLLAACARPKAPPTGSGTLEGAQPAATPKKTVPTFKTEDAFTAWVQDRLAEQKREVARRDHGGQKGASAAPSASPAAQGEAGKDGDESITNTQH